jgi:twitching motility protein PilU
MEHALAFAETGHLCLSTLHANNANQAMDRIINFFPEERHPQLLQDLSLNMRGIVSQRLIPTIDGKRAAAIEVLVGTPRAADLIAKGAVTDLKELMEKSEEQGMQTFDQALYKLYKSGRISLDEALKNADSRNNLRLRITLDENPEARAQADANGNGNLTDEAVDAGRNAEMDNSGLAGGTDRLNNEKDSEFSLIDLDDKS